ncbi:MAG: hypothetical protein ACT4NV_18390 [Rhodoferax sp.]
MTLCVLLWACVQTASAQDWITHYYRNPQPERFVAEVQDLSQGGRLSGPNTSALFSVFLGRVLAMHPEKTKEWMEQLADLQGKDRQALLRALQFSATPQASAYLKQQGDGAPFTQAPPDIRSIQPTEAVQLDMLWADFFVTGDAPPVRQIVSALNYERYSGALDRYTSSAKTEKDRQEALLETIFKAAQWSLGANTKQHARVAEILDQLFFAGELSPSETLWVAAILAKALPERYELDMQPGSAQLRKRPPADGFWRDPQGRLLPDTEAMKSRQGFGGSLLATADEGWAREWNTPSDHAPVLKQAGTVTVGQKVHVLVLFANPKTDSQGVAHVRCNLRIRDPRGRLVLEQRGMQCYRGALEGSSNATRLSQAVPVIETKADYPKGTWVVTVDLLDTQRNALLPLRTSFVLQ